MRIWIRVTPTSACNAFVLSIAGWYCVNNLSQVFVSDIWTLTMFARAGRLDGLMYDRGLTRQHAHHELSRCIKQKNCDYHNKKASYCIAKRQDMALYSGLHFTANQTMLNLSADSNTDVCVWSTRAQRAWLCGRAHSVLEKYFACVENVHTGAKYKIFLPFRVLYPIVPWWYDFLAIDWAESRNRMLGCCSGITKRYFQLATRT